MSIRGKRTIAVALAFVAAALVSAGTRRPAAAQGRPAPAREAPKFQVDPAWPHIPNGWVLGQVASAAADDQDHVWVLHRPRVVRPDQKTGPPVMEFDAAGNYVQGWGGPATASGYTWPQSEHGIYVDPKGFVWIGGSGNDDQILKFTKAGKFVMQIGHPAQKKSNQDTTSLWRPADVFLYPKTNELFVADGYGNKRIIVFDADTGAYKRMWGAFGNAPADDPAPAAEAGRAAGGGRAAGAGQGGRGAADLTRIPAKELPPTDPGPPQFNTVHGVKVSNDGIVYVADRGTKRVQVFTIDGKYITQVWIDRWCEAPRGTNLMCGSGDTAASVAFSADPAQRFLYVASRSPARVWVYDRKTLQPLDSFGRPGVGPGEFYVLHHMTTDTKGNLYTSEVEDGRRIQKWVLKGIFPVAGN
jgi:DNA-binding beta-propeller fold protein YncE